MRTAALALLVGLVLAGCGGEDDEAASTTGTVLTTATETTTEEMVSPETTTSETEETSACSDAADNVENYDTLVPGASRKEYLVLLHTLQRDCPEEAEARGLTADFLPPCKRLEQENCTMYKG